MGIISIGKGLLARIIFALHGLLTVWKVTLSYESPVYWLLAVPILFLPIEFGITFKCTKTGEWKWYVYSTFVLFSSLLRQYLIQ